MLVAFGVLAAGVGFVAIVEPGIAANVGGSRTHITLVAALAFVQGVRVVAARRASDHRQAEPPDVEHPVTPAVPGDDFDEELAKTLTAQGALLKRRNRIAIRDDLREIVVETLIQADGLRREQAREHVTEGMWTDDVYAARFLANAGVVSIDWRTRLRDIVSLEPSFRRDVRHVVAALEQRTEAAG